MMSEWFAVYLSILIIPLIAVWLMMWIMEKRFSLQNSENDRGDIFKV
jgi:hypothetical protein